MALAIAVRLAVAPLGGHPGDLPVLAAWSDAIRAGGWIGAYAASDANYPPLGMALIAASTWLHAALWPGQAVGGAAWRVMIKLPAILADLCVVWLVYRLGRGLTSPPDLTPCPSPYRRGESHQEGFQAEKRSPSRACYELGRLCHGSVREPHPGSSVPDALTRPSPQVERGRTERSEVRGEAKKGITRSRGLGDSGAAHSRGFQSSALAAALSLALNPALILLSGWWGQLDSVVAALMLAAVIAALGGRSFWAGVALGAATMVKLQGAAVAPVVVLVALTSRPHPPSSSPLRGEEESRCEGGGGSWFRLALGAISPVILGMAPFALTEQAGLVLRRAVAVIASPGWLTINALSGWYLLTGGAGNWAFNAPLTLPDTAPALAGLSARTLGALMLAAWTVGVCAFVWRARRDLSSPQTERGRGGEALLAAALLALGLFLWPTGSHERYALPALTLLAATAALPRSPFAARLPLSATRRGGWGVRPGGEGVLYLLLTLLVTLNLVWAAPPAHWLEPLAGNRPIGLAISVALLAAAAWGLWMLWVWSQVSRLDGPAP